MRMQGKWHSAADAGCCCNVELVCAEPFAAVRAHIIAKYALSAGTAHYMHWIVSCIRPLSTSLHTTAITAMSCSTSSSCSSSSSSCSTSCTTRHVNISYDTQCAPNCADAMQSRGALYSTLSLCTLQRLHPIFGLRTARRLVSTSLVTQ
eukprot:10038-Heterococcus_DN1.PRE.1